jgi:hypothetical protein
VRLRTQSANGALEVRCLAHRRLPRHCVKPSHQDVNPPFDAIFKEKLMTPYSKTFVAVACGIAIVITTACSSSLKTPATADVAVSKAAVESAASAGGIQFAPVEMNAAREKMALANQAMANKDYKRATELANQAQADAKLAQGKANSAKAQAAANALQDDIRILREELERTNK